MTKEFWITAGFTAAVAAGLHLEWRLHRRALRRLAVRVHVNGTRGKSSVTRLIAAMLREHGTPTVAKTTGTSSRLILPDGTEETVPRDGPPRIRELIWAMRRASRLGARAVVIECMAVDPELQWVSENRIVRPTLTVITNARLDHTDVQRGDPREIAAAFPVRWGGTVVTADPLVASMLQPRVRAMGGTVRLADPGSAEVAGAAGTSYLEHPENVALALEVAEVLGIPLSVAVRGLGATAPDPGVAMVIDVPDARGQWTLVNLFAANDSQSTFLALDTAREAFGLPGTPLVVFAARADRSARSVEFASALGERPDRFSKVIVWGERTGAMARRTRARGVPPERIVDAGSRSPEALTELLVEEMDETRVVVGVGNIVGYGQRWLSHLAERIEREDGYPRPAIPLEGTRT
jgi:poly-gamma-glutamate synthase PgsB/CapB